jgi:hypothetical protein
MDSSEKVDPHATGAPRTSERPEPSADGQPADDGPQRTGEDLVGETFDLVRQIQKSLPEPVRTTRREYMRQRMQEAMREAGVTDKDVADFEQTCNRHRLNARRSVAVWPALLLLAAAAVSLAVHSRLPSWSEVVEASVAFLQLLLYAYITMRARERSRGKMAILIRNALRESLDLRPEERRDGWATTRVCRSLRRAAQISDQQLAKTLRLGWPAGRENGTAVAIADHLRDLADRVVGPDIDLAAGVTAEIASFAPYLNGRATWLNFPNDNTSAAGLGRTAWTTVRHVVASVLVVGAVATPLIPQLRGWAAVGSASLLLIAAAVLGNGTGLLADAVRSRIEKG